MADPAEHAVARTENGRWVAGQSGNPKGRKPKLDFFTAAADASALRGETSQGTLTKLIAKAIELGLDKGDLAAIKLLIERWCGKETDVLQLDDPDAVLDKASALRELVAILATAAAKRN